MHCGAKARAAGASYSPRLSPRLVGTGEAVFNAEDAKFKKKEGRGRIPLWPWREALRPPRLIWPAAVWLRVGLLWLSLSVFGMSVSGTAARKQGRVPVSGTSRLFGGASVLASRLVSNLAPPNCTTARAGLFQPSAWRKLATAARSVIENSSSGGLSVPPNATCGRAATERSLLVELNEACT